MEMLGNSDKSDSNGNHPNQRGGVKKYTHINTQELDALRFVRPFLGPSRIHLDGRDRYTLRPRQERQKLR